jgi:hypothetical protein
MTHCERRLFAVRQGALLGAIAVLVVGCSSGWQVRNVTDVGDGISLDIDSCNATYDVAVEETADRVTVTVNQEDAGEPSADCADEVFVDLEAPLADRTVVVNEEHRDVRDPNDPVGGAADADR